MQRIRESVLGRMDKFVAKVTPKFRPSRAVPSEKGPAMQTRIDFLPKVTNKRSLLNLASRLREASAAKNWDHCLCALDECDDFYISYEVLKETGIGRFVQRLAKCKDNKDVAAKAEVLVGKWKETALRAIRKRRKLEERSLGSTKSTRPSTPEKPPSTKSTSGTLASFFSTPKCSRAVPVSPRTPKKASRVATPEGHRKRQKTTRVVTLPPNPLTPGKLRLVAVEHSQHVSQG